MFHKLSAYLVLFNICKWLKQLRLWYLCLCVTDARSSWVELLHDQCCLQTRIAPQSRWGELCWCGWIRVSCEMIELEPVWRSWSAGAADTEQSWAAADAGDFQAVITLSHSQSHTQHGSQENQHRTHLWREEQTSYIHQEKVWFDEESLRAECVVWLWDRRHHLQLS